MKHTRHWALPIVFAALGAALGLACQSAGAAPGPSLPIIGGPSAISGGVFVPSSGDAKDKGGSTQLMLDFRYTLPVPNAFVVPARTVLDLGVETGARHGGHSTVIPITVGELFGSGGQSPNAPGGVFGGGGIGFYVLNQSSLSATTRVGGYAEVGYNITGMVYIDAKYQFVSHANGLGLTAGLRF